MVRFESCGAELPEGARFCSRCGVPVGEAVKEEFTVSSDDLVGRIKELLHEGGHDGGCCERREGQDPLGDTSLGRGSRSNIGSLAGSLGCDSGFSNKMHCHRC
jgi:hypothetical protein